MSQPYTYIAIVISYCIYCIFCFSIIVQMSCASVDRIGAVDGPLRVYGPAAAVPHLPATRDPVADEQRREPLDARQEAQFLKL